MSKNQIKRTSIICLITSLVIFAINYLFFHFVTDEGIKLVFNEEAGKPFVAELIGTLGVLFLFAGAFLYIIYIVISDKNND